MPFPQDNSRDESNAAIAEAFRLIGQSNEGPGNFAKFDRPTAESREAGDLAEALSFDSIKNSSNSSQLSRGLVGVLVLGSLGVTLLVWQIRGHFSPETTVTSSVSIRKQETSTKPTNNSPETDTKANIPPFEPMLPAKLQAPPIVATMAPEMERQIQIMAHELANVEQGIEELKAAQAQMASGNAELVNQQKATQELTLRTAELIKDLKAAEAQMARDNGKLSEQLKETQDRMANMAELIKGGQEQLARRVAFEQKQRPKVPPATPLANANPARRQLAPPPSAVVRLQAQDAKANQ
jgi:hypothetical protein